MLETLVTALLLGLVAGLMPGAYTTVVASAALEHGFRVAARLAWVPLVTDVPPMLLTALVLHRVDDQLLTVLGVGGGALVVVLGARLVQRQGRSDAVDREAATRRTFWTIAASGLLSPAPWIFWLAAAGPLLLRAWYRSPLQGIVFATTLFAMLVGTALAVAWLAARGRRAMAPQTRRRTLRVVGVALGVMGAVMVWQSLTGNFQRLVRQQEALRARIE